MFSPENGRGDRSVWIAPENAGDPLIPFPERSRPFARNSGARRVAMSAFLGPLDATGRVPPRQQTRVAAFLVSCHGAMARQLAIALAWQTNAAWQTELNTQLYRESEFVSLLVRATSWTPDPELMFLLPSWEAAWLPRPVDGIPDRVQALDH